MQFKHVKLGKGCPNLSGKYALPGTFEQALLMAVKRPMFIYSDVTSHTTFEGIKNDIIGRVYHVGIFDGVCSAIIGVDDGIDITDKMLLVLLEKIDFDNDIIAVIDITSTCLIGTAEYDARYAKMMETRTEAEVQAIRDSIAGVTTTIKIDSEKCSCSYYAMVQHYE